MVIKINYTSSDIYVSTNVSPVYVVVNYSAVNNGGGGAIWGGITGTLSDQTDLQDALDAKFDDPTGTASQYIRGDGQLANFPTNQGGGSSVNYYLNGSVNQGTFGGDTYYEMSKTPIIGSGTNFTRTNAQGNGYIASFITDAGDPALLNIPGGNWNLEFYFAASSSGSTPSFYAELYKVSSANVFTLIASGSTNPEGITNGTVVDQYFTSIPVPQTALLATDRIAIRIFVTPSGRTITLHTEDNNLCEVLTTLSTGLNALNGLTAQVQYFATGTSGTDFAISSATDTHTFNLPTASGTNRGALSSADWTTFSGKVGGTGASGQVAYWNGTNSQTGSNNLFWDAANARLGIGTNAPTRTLDIIGTFRANNASGYGFDVGSSGQTTINTASGSTGLTISDTANAIFRLSASTYAFRFVLLGSSQRLELRDVNQSDAVRLAVSNAGNTSLGSSTDGGQRLQVYGDAFIKGSGATSATAALLVQNSSGTQLFNVRNDGTTLFGSFSENPRLYPSDTAGNLVNGGASLTIDIINTGSGRVVIKGGNQAISSGDYAMMSLFRSFVPASGTATYVHLGLFPTINQTGGANGITRGLYVNPTLTAAADWRSIEWSNNSGWGLYGAGTANNYLGGSLGIGSASLSNTNLAIGKNISGSTSAYGVFLDSVVQSGVTSIAYGFRSLLTTQAASFTLSSLNHFTASQTTQGAGSIILNQVGFDCGDMNNAYTNISYRGQISQGTSQWNLYMSGTASNYLAGQLLINTTTKGTFLLDVNGTARVSGNTTINGGDLTVFKSSLPIFHLQDQTGVNNSYQNFTATLWSSSPRTTLLNVWGKTAISITSWNFNNTGYTTTTLNNAGPQNGFSDTNGGHSLVIPINTNIQKGLTFQRPDNVLSTNSCDAIRISSATFGTYTFFRVDDIGNTYARGGAVYGSETANASAILQADSTTKGFLPPRMTTTQKNAISTPAAGLVVYDTDTNKLCCYNGTTWNDLF